MVQKVVFLTSGTTWDANALGDVPNILDSVVTIGGGSGGGRGLLGTGAGGGGGGGAYSLKANVDISAVRSAVPYAVGAAGAGATTNGTAGGVGGGVGGVIIPQRRGRPGRDMIELDSLKAFSMQNRADTWSLLDWKSVSIGKDG
jgi:hypothetical protein